MTSPPDPSRPAPWLRLAVMAAVALAVLWVYYWLDEILLLPYPVKAALRLLLFVGPPVIDTLIWQKKSWRNYLAGLLPERRQWRRLFLTALIGFTAILLINGLLGPLSRLLGQADQLRELLGRVNRSPAFLWTILLYVPLVNALGEEVFFRLWLFRDLAAAGLPRLAAVLSAGLFSLYHLALLSGLACPLLLACLAGLFAAGLFLNHIIRRDRHILSVWLIHGLVNALIISLVLHGA